MSTENRVRWWDTAGLGLAGGAGDARWVLLSVQLALAGYGRRVRSGNGADSHLFDCGGRLPFCGRVRETDAGYAGGPRLLADGGQSEPETEDRHQRLQQIFEGLADSALLVEQQSSDSRRCLGDDETRLVADVADVAESDGLSDAISSPETTDGSQRQ